MIDALLRDASTLPTREVLPHGTELVVAGVAPACLTMLLEGEVSVWREGRLLGFVEAPAPLSPGAALGRRRSSVGVRAEGPVRVARIPVDALPAGPWLDLLADHVDGLENERLELIRGHDEFWETPNARLQPGPYSFGPFRASLLLVEGPRGHVRGLLPPGLRPIPGLGDRYVIVIAELEQVRTLSPRGDGRGWSYREVTPLLPCWCDRSLPGLFVPELYPDAVLPTLLGREIYGFPKRIARTRITPRAVDVITEHQRILRARWGPRTPSTPQAMVTELSAALVPRLPGALSRIAGRGAAKGPGVRAQVYVRDEQLHRTRLDPRTLRTDALVRVPFQFMPLSDVERIAQPDVRFADGHRILAGQVLQAWGVRTGFQFGRSHVVRSYLGWVR